ncbi:hypothetical protein [Bacteroides heparinolyticus]|uniref:hypothetical protein n=1 Tax=Prevotella heparinolytica TaxID=28113 RepID=UPI0035A06F47
MENKYARPIPIAIGKGKEEDFSSKPSGLNLQRREEHGDTFAAEFDTPHRLRLWIADEEEIISREA